MVVGGFTTGFNRLPSVELFPPRNHYGNTFLLDTSCSIPDLPQPRFSHTLSLLSGGKVVVCGGVGGSSNRLDSCITWVAGATSWTLLYNMRCHPMIIIDKPELSDCCLDLFLILYSVFVKVKKITIPPQSSSLSNTITARRELFTRLGRHLLFPTPLSCLAAGAVK